MSRSITNVTALVTRREVTCPWLYFKHAFLQFPAMSVQESASGGDTGTIKTSHVRSTYSLLFLALLECLLP